jgi:tRNA threonylcarbamoyladenosine biosynthesis protein TsaE
MPPLERLSLELASEADTVRLGRALAAIVSPNVVIGLIGALGAGKTRLVRALAESLGVDPAAIASPTFVLIHEYDARVPIYHFDTYRLKSADDFEALGASDYWNAGGVCLVEWADRVLDLLPPDRWLIHLTSTSPTARHAELELPDAAALGTLFSSMDS